MTDLSTNPLYNPPKLPHGAPALDQVRVEHYLPAIKAAVADARVEIDAIKNNAEAPTFANTIEALEFAGEKMSLIASIFSNISSSNADDALRAIEEDFHAELVKFGNDVSLDPALFARVKAVHDNRAAFNLTAVQSRLLEDKYKGFVRGGALLDEAGKNRLRALSEKMSELTTKFAQNVVKSTASYEKIVDDEAELKGLPERVKNNYKAAAEAKGLKGKFLIKLSPPPIDIATHAENRALRETIYRARLDIAYKDAYDNSAIALDIVRLRHERAKLLGFDTHADFVLSERMAKSRQTVEDFLATNKTAYRAAAEEHKRDIEAYARTKGLTDVLQPWDFAFYERMLQEEKFSLDVEALRPYFELDRTLKGMFNHAEKLFGISISEQPEDKYPVYHADVKVYEVSDKKTGELLGVFYTDFIARVGAKRNGAWMSSFRGRAGDEVPLITNNCNYEKPADGSPVLLSFDEVTTMFHEFGHGLHGLLAKGPYGSLNGTNVKWDFVELPSQVQENWARTKEVLDTFAVHYKTGEKLPADMMQKLIEMENFGAGYMGLRQTFLGMLDMAYHAADPASLTSIEEIEDRIVAETSLFPRVAGPQSAAFSHIFAGGYSAGYYSYKWAEVLDADVFAAFQKKGDLYDPDLAAKLRKLYESGDNEDPAILFENLMGRGPDASALFLRQGITPPAAKPAKQAPRPPAA